MAITAQGTNTASANSVFVNMAAAFQDGDFFKMAAVERMTPQEIRSQFFMMLPLAKSSDYYRRFSDK